MAKKEMDKLAWENAQALAAGMSYGKWKAKQEPVKIERKEYPDDWPLCEYCYKPFKPLQGKRFCDVDCRKEAYREKEREISRNYYLTHKKCKKEGAMV